MPTFLEEYFQPQFVDKMTSLNVLVGYLTHPLSCSLMHKHTLGHSLLLSLALSLSLSLRCTHALSLSLSHIIGAVCFSMAATVAARQNKYEDELVMRQDSTPTDPKRLVFCVSTKDGLCYLWQRL